MLRVLLSEIFSLRYSEFEGGILALPGFSRHGQILGRGLLWCFVNGIRQFCSERALGSPPSDLSK